ncbi:MAG: xanthine dehydrogenase family protein subunit M [Candidatus Solibacter usitatus]|nr:xanthine dehydrogenase family protein subunit M [Candidatus Solibacter usitatus]
MIAHPFDYLTPKSLPEALLLLADPDAKALAGGMSLIPMMKLRLAAPAKLVDLRGVPGLTSISEESGRLKIGALATHFDIESSRLVRAKCPLLAMAAAHIGDVQVRNMGTIGGSIAHADPAADYPAALQALEATISIAGVGGTRAVSAAEFFVDTFTTAVGPGELVVEVSVPVEAAGTGTSYQKCLQPASGFAIVGVAARLQAVSGNISMARIGVTGLSGCSFRANGVEALLESGSDPQAAAAAIANGIDANSDIHASAEYRLHLARVYAAKAIRAALAAAR